MSELIMLHPQKGTVLHPEAIKLTVFLKKLKARDLMFVHLAYDYNSILKQFPLREKIRRAKITAYGSPDHDVDSDKVIAGAIEEYRGLQYDSKREIVETIKNKIATFNALLLAENEPKKAREIAEAIEDFEERLTRTQREIDAEQRARVLKGGGQLTFVEEWQLSKLQKQKDDAILRKATGIQVLE